MIVLILAGMGATIGALAPWEQCTCHQVVISNLTHIMEKAWKTSGTLSGLRVPLDSLTNGALDNRQALGYILAEQGGIEWLPTSPVCSPWINNTG